MEGYLDEFHFRFNRLLISSPFKQLRRSETFVEKNGTVLFSSVGVTQLIIPFMAKTIWKYICV